MLPFLSAKKMVTAISTARAPAGSEPEVTPVDEDFARVASDILLAIETKSPHNLAIAMQNMFELCGTAEQAEHTDPYSPTED